MDLFMRWEDLCLRHSYAVLCAPYKTLLRVHVRKANTVTLYVNKKRRFLATFYIIYQRRALKAFFL